MMRPMLEILQKLRGKLERDAGEGFTVVARKGVRYARELATAPLYLRSVNHRGAGVRTLGRPRVDNQGRMSIGAGTLIRSVNVPVELATGPSGVLEIGEEVRLNYG